MHPPTRGCRGYEEMKTLLARLVPFLLVALWAPHVAAFDLEAKETKTAYDVTLTYVAADGTGALSFTDPAKVPFACASGRASLSTGSTGTVELHGTPLRTTTPVSGTLLSTLDGTEGVAGKTFTNTAKFFRFKITSSGTGTLNIKCSNVAGAGGGGQGVLGVGPLASMPSSATAGDLWQRTDAAAGASANCIDGTGTTVVLCQRTAGNVWTNAGNAGSGDNLGTGVATTDVNVSQNAITNALKVNNIWYANSSEVGTSTAGIQERINAAGKGSATNNIGATIVLPKGTNTITSKIRIGGDGVAVGSGGDGVIADTMQMGISLSGHGSGIENTNNPTQKLAGTTLVWGGANGGTMIEVWGMGHHLSDFMLVGPEAGYGIVQRGNNTTGSVTGKNVYERIHLSHILDTTNAATGWAFVLGLTNLGQNDHTILDQVRVSNSRHCLLQGDQQAVQNEVRNFECAGFTATPGIEIRQGGISFNQYYVGTGLANAVGVQVNSCATQVALHEGSYEWTGDNGKFIRFSNPANGECNAYGNPYGVHVVDHHRFLIMAAATNQHYCIDASTNSGLVVRDNMWTSNGSGSAYRCKLRFDNPDASRTLNVSMSGNKEGWFYGSEADPIVIDVTSAAANQAKVIGEDHGKLTFHDDQGTAAIAKDATGLYADNNGDGDFDSGTDSRFSIPSFDITNFTSIVNQVRSIDLDYVDAPFHKVGANIKSWFAIDGAKSLCTNIYDTPYGTNGVGVQTSGSPDEWCDSGGRVRAGKTKTVSLEVENTNLTESESYAAWFRAIGGGDSDNAAIQIEAINTGGSKALGDEGNQAIRAQASDNYYHAVGTTTSNIGSGGSSAKVVNITGLGESASTQLGEGKLMVFPTHANAVNLDISSGGTATGTINASGTYHSGFGTSQGLWTVANATGVHVGDCFATTDSSTTDPNGVSGLHWLYIKAVNTGTGVITTEWKTQGVDYGNPDFYPASEGVAKAKAAPCAKINSPAFYDADYVADAATLTTASSFPAVGSGSDFYVSAYGNYRNMVGHFLYGQKLGHGVPGAGVLVQNVLDGVFGSRMGSSAVEVGFTGSLSNLVDGYDGAWLHGYRCIAGACYFGFRHDYQDVAGFGQAFGLIDFGDTRWAAGDNFDVLYVNDSSALNLKLDPDIGWNVGGDPFAKTTTAAKTADHCVKWDSSGRLVDAGAACGSGSGGDSIQIDAVDAASPVNFSSDGSQEFIRCTGVGAPDASCAAAGDILTRHIAGSVGTAEIATNGVGASEIVTDGVGATEIAAGAVGSSEAAALDAGDTTTGVFADALVSGSAESDEITGLTVAQGGTGAATFTSNAILKGAGTAAVAASGVLIDASNNVTGAANLTASGTVTAGTFVGSAQAVPSIILDDTVDGTPDTSPENKIEADATAADNGRLALSPESGDATYKPMVISRSASSVAVVELGKTSDGAADYVKIAEGGILTFQGTASITLPSGVVTNGMMAANTLTPAALAATMTYSDGDLIDLSAINGSGTAEGLKLPQATSCASSTAEGQICWDTDDDNLVLGASGSVVTIWKGGTVASLVAALTDEVTAVWTWMQTPSSANLASALTDETGSGKAVFDTAPTFAAGSASASSWPKFTSGTLMTTAEDGAIEQDADAFYATTDAGNRGVIPIQHCIRADSARSLTNDTNMNALFNSPTNGRITLETGAYRFEGMAWITGMSTTSGNGAVDILGAGTATTGSWLWRTMGIDNTAPTTVGTQSGTWSNTSSSAANAVTPGAGTATAFEVKGTVEVTVAGTVIPSYTLGVGSAAQLEAGSHICFSRMGSTTMTNVGQWD